MADINIQNGSRIECLAKPTLGRVEGRVCNASYVDTNFWKNPADVNSDEDVRQTSSPEEALLEFLQNTYEVSANLGNWDRSALERIPMV